MEVFLIFVLLVVFVMVIYVFRSVSSRLEDIHTELNLLRNEISKSNSKQPVKEETVTAVVKPTVPEKPAVNQRWESGFKVMEEARLNEERKHQEAERLKKQPLQETRREEPVLAVPKPSFLERHPDLERFVGENLTNKIGIGILVLAIGFFVKYAIDNQWIGEVGRVAIGLLCGGILTALAHRMRNSYAGFSSVLLGGGLAIFYFTITLAFHEYHLFSQTVTFIIMVAITGFAVILSQLYNRQELAIIALIGGFATPFMASNGGGNYKVLFIYLIILNSGLLAISYFKTWRILNILAFAFTVILFGSWLFTLPYQQPADTWKHTLIFASIFYLLFIFINLAHNIKENKRFLASDFCIILTNTCLYFSVGLYAIDRLNAELYRGLFTASLGIFNLLLSYSLFLKRRTDPNILYLLIGITVSLISLTAPIQLEGNNISLFWATETVLLYWLFQKSRIKIIQLASLLVWVALLISVLMDWVDFYGYPDQLHRVMLNKGFITMAFSALACFALFRLRKKDQENTEAKGIYFFPGANTFFLTSLILLFIAGLSEINLQFSKYYTGSGINTLYQLAFTFGFILCFRWMAYRYAALQMNRRLSFFLLAAALVINLLTLPAVFSGEIKMLASGKNEFHFVTHWIAALFISLIIYQLIKSWRETGEAALKQAGIWILCTYIIVFLSTELLLLVNMLFYSPRLSFEEIERIYGKTVLPILWGVCSFTFMWLGMKYKFRTLRIISLTLFTVTLAKLFLFDIRNIPPAGKIAAFFCLGVLLLVISFMYQRVKKIIIEDEQRQS